MSRYDCPLTVDLTEREIALIAQAIEFKKKPRGWRDSEFAVTKATAHRGWSHLKPGDNILDLFDWGILQSEVARFHKFGLQPAESDAQLMLIFVKIRAAIDGSDRARQIEQAADDLRNAERAVEQAEKNATAARRTLQSLTKYLDEKKNTVDA